jgi:diaminopimelate epimerase
MTHPFHRYTAAGNTFLVMNTWEHPLSLSREEMREFVRGACDYNAGAGADGLILINQPANSALPAGRGAGGEAAAFRMDFYNPDGTTGMLCGNGARCAAQAARQYGYATANTVRFEVLGAINTAEFLPNGSTRVFFQDPIVIRLNFSIPLQEKDVTVSYVDLGSQHVVVFCDGLDIEKLNVEQLGSLFRWHPAFAPIGANANFIEVRKDGAGTYLRIRTFERGVEGETLACGTGCMSSAIVASMTGCILNVPIRLLTQSGEFVTVNFTQEGEHVRNLSLEGNVIRGEKGILEFDEETEIVRVEYV